MHCLNSTQKEQAQHWKTMAGYGAKSGAKFAATPYGIISLNCIFFSHRKMAV
jgi:hypothetical protein